MADRRTKRCSVSLTAMKTQTKTPMHCHLTPVTMAVINKSPTTGVGEHVERREPLRPAGGTANGGSHPGEQRRASSAMEMHRPPRDPADPLCTAHVSATAAWVDDRWHTHTGHAAWAGGQNRTIRDNVDGPRACPAKCHQSDRGRHAPCGLMDTWNLNYRQTRKPKPNGRVDTEVRQASGLV